MLTGQLPFERSTPMATMLAHIEDAPPAPSIVAPRQGIPPRLDGVVLQAMAKDPRQRFRTATAMARAMEGVARDTGGTSRLPEQGPLATQVAPRVPKQSVNVRPSGSRRPPPPAVPPAADLARRGRGPLTAILTLIVIAMTAVAAYLVYEVMSDNGDPPPVTTTPTATTTPEATDQIIAPPTSEPEPTATLEPTSEPTLEPPSEPTTEPPPPTSEPPPLIEPRATLAPTEEQIIEPSN
jgi:hypothetical protein